ncbi:hypothetical protein ACOME3_008266 [Neoechinorhynchus agilis]
MNTRNVVVANEASSCPFTREYKRVRKLSDEELRKTCSTNRSVQLRFPIKVASTFLNQSADVYRLVDNHDRLSNALILIRNALSPKGLSHFSINSILDYPNRPNTRNNLVNSKYLRWATVGEYLYDWEKKEYFDNPDGRLPEDLKACIEAITESCLAQYNGIGITFQTAIVNYYPLNSNGLCAHQDVYENAIDRPLVTLSLGQSGVFLAGGLTKDEGSSILVVLEHGDILAMCADARRAFHAVPKVVKVEGPSLTNCEDDTQRKLVEAFLNRHRINLSFRMVK